MKLAITGFSNSGKTTIFNALTGLNLDTAIYPTPASAEVKSHIGTVKVPDKRLNRLSSLYKDKKKIHTTVEYVDYPGITSAYSGGDISQNTRVFDVIRDADAIVHVVRVFKDDSVIHPFGIIDPLRDVQSFETELILGDLEFAEKRLERMELAWKKGLKQDEGDREFLLKCKKALEDETSLRNISFSDKEKMVMLSFQLLSIKPEIIVLNIGEADLNTEKAGKAASAIENYFKGKGSDNVSPVIPLCGKIEMEIAQLHQEEAKMFLDDLGISEPAMNRLCRVSYDTLGLISFFTIGKKEVRAWAIKKGTRAIKAAGKVHTDMERGFIRAETIHFEDFIASGENMVKAREKGLVRLEGKTYIVNNGDIINFKFNV